MAFVAAWDFSTCVDFFFFGGGQQYVKERKTFCTIQRPMFYLHITISGLTGGGADCNQIPI